MNKNFCMAYHAFHYSLLQLNMLLLSKWWVRIFVSWVYAIYPKITTDSLFCFSFFLVHIIWDPCPRFKNVISSLFLSGGWVMREESRRSLFYLKTETGVTIVAKEISKLKQQNSRNHPEYKSHKPHPLPTIIIAQSHIHPTGNILRELSKTQDKPETCKLRKSQIFLLKQLEKN